MTAALASEQPSPSEKWFGVVPSHWTTPRVATLFREVDRPADPKLPVLSVSIHSGVSDNELADEDRDRKVNLSEDRSKYQRVQPGDLVYNMMRAWQGAFGTVAVDGLVSPAYVVAEPKVSFRTRFVELLLQTASGMEEVRRFSKGIADFRMRLYWEHFRNIVVCLPPLAEQDIILARLDRECAKIDRLVDKKGRFLELLREKRLALIARAVTQGIDPDVSIKSSGVKWLGNVPSNWTVTPLKYLCRVRTGSRDTAHAVPGGGYPFFVRSQIVEEIDTYSADCEAILTAGDGAGVGKVYHYYTGKFDYHQRVYMLSQFEGVRGRYLFYYLSALFAAVALDGGAKSTVDSLRMPVFMGFAVAYPSLSEQDRILAFVDGQLKRIDDLVTTTERSVKLLKEHRFALITAAVTGKIDVRGLAAKNMKAAA
ncbi:restriction endonuclease subunit S [Sphingomonas zeae]|uniref:Type I restriction modification DNA specificity domain-containing protein n=1 Tax=Sphingomonas zeae TaxID=1646122 RepID=A0A7Y6EHU1_9SPHN|nr:restriction endonuclease subunit S [Sphingomonas zeae]MBB4047670.1 type I restriction enzyme S subunit [Sphingomonas zeae]NUU47661.1 hypothetical protein [Sphingomonas zeae]